MRIPLPALLLFALCLVALPASADCPTPAPTFDVTVGCAYGGASAVAAPTNGNDARPAIQQCLLAAGDYYKECVEPTTPAVPVEVSFGSGTYRIGGAFRSSMVDLRLKNDPHWIGLILPRGVAMRGQGPSSTTLTIRPSGNHEVTTGTGYDGTRAGTFMIVAGIEKTTDPDIYPNAGYGYCDEELISEFSADEGHPRPLCANTTQTEREKGGAYNAIYDMKLLGDSYAMVRHVDRTVSGQMNAISSAVVVIDGLKFKMDNVWAEEWYRAVWVIANGADIRDSTFVNNPKAGLYINGIGTQAADGRSPAYKHGTHGQQPFDVYSNWLGNETTWLAQMETWKTALSGTWNLYSSLAGFFFGGNLDTCGDLTFQSNRIYRGRTVIDPPCGEDVLLRYNWISLSGVPIEVGAGDTDPPGGLLTAKVVIKENEIDTSLSGIYVQGCNYLGEYGGRCAEIASDRLEIEDNTMTTFRAYRESGSDVHLDKMVRWIGTGAVTAGITVADLSGVKINGNSITDLKRGTQMAGIFVHTSYLNRESTDCYVAAYPNENIHVYGNEIEFDNNTKSGSYGFPSRAIGIYSENTEDFGADHRDFRLTGYPAATMTVDENRAITTQVSWWGYGWRDGLCESATGTTTCKRALLSFDHAMSAARLTNSSWACYGQTKQTDDEFIKDPADQ